MITRDDLIEVLWEAFRAGIAQESELGTADGFTSKAQMQHKIAFERLFEGKSISATGIQKCLKGLPNG